MKQKAIRSLLLCLTALISRLLLPSPAALAPTGRHCGGVGPLDPTFCGCTWGAVYYRGQPVADAPVSLTFGGATLPALFDTALTAEPYPFYTVSGSELGAKRGDTMTLTVTLGDQSVTRAFRAEPENDGDNRGEQAIALVLPEMGQWSPWLTGSYTRTMLLVGESLWAGGAAGLIQIDPASGVATPQTLPWPQQAVTALATSNNGPLWVAGPTNLARFDGAGWQKVAPPFAAPIRALAVDPENGGVWVGGGNNSGALAYYDGSWQTITATAQPVMTLTADRQGGIWAGTWGGGVYYRPAQAGPRNQGWQHFRVNQGLASDYILSAVAAENAIWFGTRPYQGSQGVHGGISRYSLASQGWQSYGRAEGLPPATELPSAPSRVYALGVDSQGTPWAGTERGIQFLATPTHWLTDTVTTRPVQALLTYTTTVLAATADGTIQRLDRSITPGAPPVVTLTGGGENTMPLTATVALTATAHDQDEEQTGAQQILAWAWVADQAGPLCTTPGRCRFPAATLGTGTHQLTLRVQDDEGVWSANATTTVTVVEALSIPTPPLPIYLPWVNRGP